ncbi:hypothetical protein G7Y89_g3445 [Cudoniella acicularis]|uniref:Wings apart-like protein C-terminal domain-containing protein n=1 Tax=Cudoniella acicularis TaxID=354080 RepID=A0A8H4RTC4_9HELO|nr:hypothetical protein G7Y89_g3445 [Cudoniella acicularis]
MATIQGVGMARKRITTYGKASRKRVPEYNFTSVAQKSQTPEVQIELEPPISPTPPLVPTKLKSVRHKSPSKAPSSSAPTTRDIWDVPSSDEDIASIRSKPAPKLSQKMKVNRVSKHTSIKDGLGEKTGIPESRKRMKFSPAAEVPLKPLAADSFVPTALPKMPIASTKHKFQGKGHTSTVVSRPKPQAEVKAPRTPHKTSPPPPSMLLVTPSPQLSDVDMMDVDPDSKYISPRGLQMWKGLLESEELIQEQSLDTSSKKVHRSKMVSASSTHGYGLSVNKSSKILKRPQNVRPKLPRRRLIDSLVEQIKSDEETEEDDDSGEDVPKSLPGVIPPLHILSVTTDTSRSTSLVPELANAAASASSTQSSQNAGPKITYSRQRSMLAEEDLMQALALDMPSQPVQGSQGRKPRRGSLPSLQPLPSFHEEEEDDGTGAVVRSVHELRQAGANNRFLDEIEDLLDRIGNPTGGQISMRRSGLLDMASKLKDKNFARQFRANSVEQRLFVHLGQETDIISGSLMISLLIAVLVDGNVAHVMVQQLRRQGIARLLIRLLESEAGIVVIAKERKNNMTKIAQKLMFDHHEYLLQLPVWEELKPRVLSPRTLALKCLELMVRQTREAGNAGDIFSKELTTKLFAILTSASDDRSWALPEDPLAIEFYLALSALESHSITARTVHDENIWITDYLPIIADALEVALRKPVDDFEKQQALILRLTLNVTNNNPKASDVFARSSLMSVIGKTIVAEFRLISRFMTEEDFSVAFEHLIMVLGVMINFAEWSPTARESFQGLEGHSNDPLDDMIQTFMDDQERTSQAESVVETQKNVAFGYLSVLLGYLALLPAISERIRVQQPRKTLRPLVASIEEFIGHHKTVDSQIAEDEDGHNPHSGLTERLESLVHKLGALQGSEKH